MFLVFFLQNILCFGVSAKFEKIVFLPDSDVEYVAADGGGDGHVAEPLPCHDHAGDEVRYRGSSSQEGQPHHLDIIC